MIRYVLFGISMVVALQTATTQPALSPRTASYDIELQLDTALHQINARQTLTFKNPSGDTLYTMPFHMYYNAFKNNQTTFNTGASRIPRNKSEAAILDCEWSWIEVQEVKDKDGQVLSTRYIQPDDGNIYDHTVLEVQLKEPILPFAEYQLQMRWHSQIPKAMIRTGYNRDYYFMAQWFPKLGVYEPAGMRFSENGQWNCHQYHANTEYYGEFGVYKLAIDVPEHYVVGASGTLTEKTTKEGRAIYHFVAEDVIDFTWTACPRFEEITDDWKGVKIKLLITPEHLCNQDRFLTAAKHSLDFFEEYLERYPYPTLTIVSPPYYGLFSGAMEYPTLITAPTLCYLPRSIRTTETLVIHELVHQYFMQMVATNEQEEPWLDEGFTSFFEAKIMDRYYPRGIVDLFGIHIGSTEFRRGRFINAENIKVNPLSDFGWHFEHGSYAELFYGKAAVLLRTLEGLIGEEVMQQLMYTYFQRWKFRHPCREDFIAIALEVSRQHHGEEMSASVQRLLHQGIYGTDACDYELNEISVRELPPLQGHFEQIDSCYRQLEREVPLYESRVLIFRREGMQVPVEVLVRFDDGSSVLEKWDGISRSHDFTYRADKKVVSAHIDPHRKVPLDRNLINNSYTLSPTGRGLRAYALTVASWVEGLMANLMFLI
jgi:hypothetical protein